MTASPREVARWARIVTSNRLICLGADWVNTGQGGNTFGGADFCTPIDRLAEAFEEVAMGPDEIARWTLLSQWSFRKGDVSSGFNPGAVYPREATLTDHGSNGRTVALEAGLLDNLHPDADMPDLLTTKQPPRRCAIPLFVEACAGTAAMSLRLERDGARPPVSRMGAKTGYADIILALAGLKPGDKAEHYVWCEPDDGVRLLLHAYRDADLAREAAAIIRSWADEEPRALWERLRAEGPARCPPVDAREVGRLAFLWRGPFSQKGPDAGIGTPEGKLPSATFGGFRPALVELQDLPPFSQNPAGLPATIHDDARTLPLPDRFPDGAIVYADPPYVDTTGYAHDFPRDEVVTVLRECADRGARVMVSEAVPVAELTKLGWHAVEITAMRKGQKRTFSKQQREWVTCSFRPNAQAVNACARAILRSARREAAPTAEQADLFGSAA